MMSTLRYSPKPLKVDHSTGLHGPYSMKRNAVLSRIRRKICLLTMMDLRAKPPLHKPLSSTPQGKGIGDHGLYRLTRFPCFDFVFQTTYSFAKNSGQLVGETALGLVHLQGILYLFFVAILYCKRNQGVNILSAGKCMRLRLDLTTGWSF